MTLLLRNVLRFRPLALRSLSDVTKPSADLEPRGSPLLLSDACVEKLKEVAGPGESLRITVESGGCSGFQYDFALDSKVGEDDILVEKDGAKVVIDKVSLSLLEGSVVDYQSEMIRSSFRVKSNPNADSGCSCGVSFSVKLD